MLNLESNFDWTDSSAKIAINNEDIANTAKMSFEEKLRERRKGLVSNSSLTDTHY